jgi:hypothetical protein
MNKKGPATKFVVTLVPQPGIDAIRALRWALKRLLRQYGLRCVSIREQHMEDDS